MSSPIYVIHCFEPIFNKLLTDFLNKKFDLYYTDIVPGAGTCCGYSNFCKSKGNNPYNSIIENFIENIMLNINLAMSLNDFKDIYLINHQNCKVMKTFLAENYNQKKEIEINSEILEYAINYLSNKFPNHTIHAGLIDINGTIANYYSYTKVWHIVHRGFGKDKKGLWYHS